MPVGDVLLWLRVMVVRCGVVWPGGDRQPRIRVTAGSCCCESVVVMRMGSEVDAERRRSGSGRLRDAVRRWKVRRLEIGGGGGVGADIARSSVSAGSGAASRRRRAAVKRTTVNCCEITGRSADDEVASVLLLHGDSDNEKCAKYFYFRLPSDLNET